MTRFLISTPTTRGLQIRTGDSVTVTAEGAIHSLNAALYSTPPGQQVMLRADDVSIRIDGAVSSQVPAVQMLGDGLRLHVAATGAVSGAMGRRLRCLARAARS